MVGLTPSPGPLTPADLGWSAMDDSVRAPLDVAALRDGLVGPGMPWRELAVVAETGSTNGDLLAPAGGVMAGSGWRRLAHKLPCRRGWPAARYPGRVGDGYRWPPGSRWPTRW